MILILLIIGLMDQNCVIEYAKTFIKKYHQNNYILLVISTPNELAPLFELQGRVFFLNSLATVKSSTLIFFIRNRRAIVSKLKKLWYRRFRVIPKSSETF